MTKVSKALGAKGEALAQAFLKKKKYQILKTNLSGPLGEIDILARDGRTLVIVEVKAKTNTSQGSAIEMITPAKRQKLILLALKLQNQFESDNVRIDVVAINNAAENPIIKHHKGVIEYYG